MANRAPRNAVSANICILMTAREEVALDAGTCSSNNRVLHRQLYFRSTIVVFFVQIIIFLPTTRPENHDCWQPIARITK